MDLFILVLFLILFVVAIFDRRALRFLPFVLWIALAWYMFQMFEYKHQLRDTREQLENCQRTRPQQL
jgi:Ca2+/Na+ antiporter